MKGLDKVNKQDKAAARELYKRIRDLHPMNDKGSRRYWNSRYITAPNHAGLYIELVSPNGSTPMYCLRQIARDSKQPILEGSGTLPYINTVPNVDGSGTFYHFTEWKARQALRLFTEAYNNAGARELYVWHNAHTVTDSRDTPGVVVFYTDRYHTSADCDTDMERNGQGARLWTN